VLPNEEEEENTPDIELLYKAMLQVPEKIKSMFK
jgi:ABC-2 type transport system ATP-binding protein